MSLEAAQRQPNFADAYERTVVPAIFDRYARDLVERARPIGASDRILDLGCGTGIVSRILRERLGGAANIVGVDVSRPMIEMARSVAPEIDFREANAMALPFPDGSFDLVLCQEMLQFVPDRLAALLEVRRVLTPGGRFITSAWRPRSEQPFFEALGRVAERHLGKSNDARWSLDGPALAQALTDAGFADIRLEIVSFTDRFREFSTRMNAMASNFDLTALSEADKERRFAAIETDSAEVFARFALDGGFGAPSVANVVTAISPAKSQRYVTKRSSTS
jgi:ubiquinone/menaquinone biosynthesis C-methylase UbiE